MEQVWIVRNENTGSVYGVHKTKEGAIKTLRAWCEKIEDGVFHVTGTAENGAVLSAHSFKVKE